MNPGQWMVTLEKYLLTYPLLDLKKVRLVYLTWNQQMINKVNKLNFFHKQIPDGDNFVVLPARPLVMFKQSIVMHGLPVCLNNHNIIMTFVCLEKGEEEKKEVQSKLFIFI